MNASRALPATSIKTAMGRCVIVAASAVALLAGCGGAVLSGTPAVPVPSAMRATVTGQQPVSTRCKQFAADFDELVACERANGTLDSFDSRIEWRARYFVRYWAMPCGEDPTEQVAYVFQMVTTDLDRDRDLRKAQRSAIRGAMFDGKVRCK